jgi:hypothetical protein
VANDDRLYCRVDPKTGDILDGPRTLPHSWGNVVGFHNLQPKDVRRYNWFPVDMATTVPTPYGYMFLPERSVVIKVHHGGHIAGKRQYAMGQLRAFAKMFAERDFSSAVMGEVMFFSNSHLDQIHRLNCHALQQNCVSTARTIEGVYISVTIPYEGLPRLIEDSVMAYNFVMRKVEEGLKAISNASDLEVAAMIDSGFVDFFDE